MSDRLDQTLVRAKAEGLLPADAERPVQETRPWPVVLLTALGAWLSAMPLLGVVGLLLGDLITRGVGPYFVGLLVLVAAVLLLRTRHVPLFIEQLAVPALLVGGGALGFGVFRDLKEQAGALVLAGVALALVLVIPRPWLRVLLGVLMGALVSFALMAGRHFGWAPERHGGALLWQTLHLLLALWLVMLAAQRYGLLAGTRARYAAALESLGAGWLLCNLVGLVWFSGMTFMGGGSFRGGFVGEVANELTTRRADALGGSLMPWGSALLAVLAGAVAARAWPTWRRPLNLVLCAVLVVLAWALPALGATLLALSICATTQRWRLAAAAAVVAAWIVGSFYYQLQWSLASKAVVLVGAGVLLGAIGWLGRGVGSVSRSTAAAPGARGRGAMLIGLTAVAVLAVVNVAIWQKEVLIAEGRPVFVELAPADPRSLMQGDYMRLNFRLPEDIEHQLDALVTRRRPQVVARRDARGVATLLRIESRGRCRRG